MSVVRSIFDEPHAQSLEVMAARALGEGDDERAFRLADRRCRIAPAARAHAYVLRAEAARRMGDEAGALGDLEKAIELAPDDVAANRALLALGSRAQQVEAARALLRCESNNDILRSAVRLLFEEGDAALASVRVFDDWIEGWAAWRGDGPLSITVSDDRHAVRASHRPDRSHSLADEGEATDFRLARPRSSSPQSIELAAPQGPIRTIRAAPNDPSPATPPVAQKEREGAVTVIVPIYADFAATQACLDGLMDELKARPRHRAILVDDASPDARIARALDRAARSGPVDVLVNARNLGFIGSINRALAHVVGGDVILLNADTIVPPGFIDRLATSSRSSADIGTLTPLSNNGEFASFPIPNIANPLETRADVERIDRIAARVNAGVIVDLPSGIGFCLYIKRRCLDAVGPLCEDYERGYLEDVDYCLRARELGWRNVCAASVYVGHAGSKSFGREKRALVVRNLETLERRFPGHRAESAAFSLADPLRVAREAIERAGEPSRRQTRLLVAGVGEIAAIARARAEHLAARGVRAIIAQTRRGPRGLHVRLFDPAGGSPQSVEFRVAEPSEGSTMLAFLRNLRVSEVECLQPGKMPTGLVGFFRELRAPLSALVADAEGLVPAFGDLRGARAGVADGGPDSATESSPWRGVLHGAHRILAPGPQALALTRRAAPDRTVTLEETGLPARPAIGPGAPTEHDLGIVLIGSGAAEQILLDAIASAFRGLDIGVVIIGDAALRLMRQPNVAVTGKVEAREIARIAAAWRIGRMFVNLRRPLFGHPLAAAAQALPLPLATFDWSMGALAPQRGDLLMDPRLEPDLVANGLVDWARRL
jgi:GT2 family glycosyltransferase